jgi:5'(3')-deoxyribonucleotidase
MTKEIFAIDVGGVLASKQHDGEPMLGAKDAIDILSDKFELWIVSMCSESMEYKTTNWLYANEFHKYIPRRNWLYIAFERGNKNRALVEIGANYFIDDRIKHIKPAFQVQSLKTLFHFSPQNENMFKFNNNNYIKVYSWMDVLDYLSLL